MSEFDVFGTGNEETVADPAADFLAQEEAELAKIENNDPFEAFESAASANDPFNQLNEIETDQLATNVSENLNIKENDVYSSIQSVDKLSKEPEQITRWREEQKLRLSTKDAEEELKKKEWAENAKKELDDWYKNRQEQLTKTIANNKVNNKATIDELAALREKADSEAEWDRISKLCDFNPKANKNTRDVSRMRSILLQLKQTPLVR